MNKDLILMALQLILFIPFYFIWKKDCKNMGKENLAVSLEERFIAFMVVCPIWILIFID
jgi:hypothetical protein